MNKHIHVVENKARVLTMGDKVELRNRKRKTNNNQSEYGINKTVPFILTLKI